MAITTRNGSAEDIEGQIAALRADLVKLTESVGHGVERKAEQAGRMARDAKESVAESVAAHPLTALGVAAGVGYLLGVLTRR